MEHQTIPQIREGKQLARRFGAPWLQHTHGSIVEFKPTALRVLEYHVGLQPCVYGVVRQCEEQLLQEVRWAALRLQSADSGPDSQQTGVFLHYILKGLSADPKIKNHPVMQEGWLADKITSLLYIYPHIRDAKDFSTFLSASLIGYRMLCGRHLITEMLGRILGVTNLQSDVGDLLKQARSAYEKGKEVYNGPLAEKISRLLGFMLVHGILEKFNVPLTERQYQQLSDKRFQREYKSVEAMWLCVFDTSLFICERAFEAYSTGNVMAFVQTSSQYDKWFQEADRVLSLSPFLGNLEAHGTTYFSFVSDVNTLIEQGEAYVTYIRSTSALEASHMRGRLSNLKLLKATTLTRSAAQESRKAPFGILIAGGSSVAKSSFAEMIFHYYGSLFHLETTSNMRYTRCPADEYWSNFMSSMWCIQMDDIAFLQPSKTNEVDPTLKELLNVVNNVPYTPPQAALEDKGKTPVLARLCIATTNAEDLNAHEYFHCPLAVRRRLPYVVNVVPKKEFLHPNGKFIDPSKLGLDEKGYPDFWQITVKKIVPVCDGTRDRARLEVVQIFDHVSDFLQHFGRAALEHQKFQMKSEACSEVMGTISVCTECCRPQYDCECAVHTGIEQSVCDVCKYLASDCRCELQTDGGLLVHLYQKLLEFYFTCKWFNALMVWCAKFTAFRHVLRVMVMPFLSRTTQMDFINSTLNRLRPKNIQQGVALVSALITFVALFAMSYSLSPSKMSLQTTEEEEKERELREAEKLAFERNAKENVWYKPTIQLSRFDLPKATQSMATMPGSEYRDYVANNVMRIRLKGSSGSMKTTGAFVPRGNIMFCNNHAFGSDEFWDITVVVGENTPGISPNFNFRLHRQSLVRREDLDLVAFEVRAMPPRKDITKIWTVGDLPLSKARIISREDDGTVTDRVVHRVYAHPQLMVTELNRRMPVLIGVADRPTTVGHCGSLWMAETPKGPVIVGFHALGYNNDAGAISLPHFVVMEVEKQVSAIAPVEVTRGPQLGLQNEIQPGQIHHKSNFRFQEKGVVQHYGTLPGFRPRPRSKVQPTPICDLVTEFMEKPVAHGQPEMSGWKPWHNNIVKMVDPPTKFDERILKECTRAFLADIIQGLNAKGGWKQRMRKLSRHAAVNGLAGVKFLDRMNMHSSMGFPWNKSKKFFVRPDPTEELPDAVTFGEDFWARVDKIEAAYRDNSRAHPVFVAHLKDEATALEKCAIGKTRVFTGAPADWSVVVRIYLLPFVKMLQEDTFLFEACPGTACQSDEWGRMYRHLTQFGENKIVAGDYSAFDKRMPAAFILAAFDIMAGVAQEAGWPEEDVRVIRCIGTDTAFPLTNMNGDLVEFYGTNPSGHPLTVVVNSLVNSLYMRYAYSVLNPNGGVADFKDKVALLTYGDDNIMGVSDEAPWFNHTAIQEELARIGVVYTMADKESESVPYLPISECSFLKRTWRWEPALQDYACPLEIDSIHKSLTMWLPSETVCPEEQLVAVIASANSEMFFHGRELFEHYRHFFQDIVSREPYSHYVTDSTLPTWETLVERWVKASEK